MMQEIKEPLKVSEILGTTRATIVYMYCKKPPICPRDAA